MAFGSLPLSKTPERHAFAATKPLNSLYAINSQVQRRIHFMRSKYTGRFWAITESLHKFHYSSQPPAKPRCDVVESYSGIQVSLVDLKSTGSDIFKTSLEPA